MLQHLQEAMLRHVTISVSLRVTIAKQANAKDKNSLLLVRYVFLP